MPANTATARLGRFQSRLSRIVDLVSSRTVDVPIPGRPNETTKETIWTGLMYRADGKTQDTILEWENSGAFRNQRGVASPNDLALFMRPLTDQELKAAVAALPAFARPTEEKQPESAAAPAAAIEAAPAVDPEAAVKDPRVSSKLAALVWDTYQYMLAQAVSDGILPADVRVTTVRGNWAGLIADTLVSYLDNPEKEAESKPPELPKSETGDTAQPQ